MGNSQGPMMGDLEGFISRQSSIDSGTLERQDSVESETEEIIFEPDYEDLLCNLTILWLPHNLKALLSSFLQKPFAGSTEMTYMRQAESHMRINIQFCYDDEGFQFSWEYLAQLRTTWFLFDPGHTGTILFTDIVKLINTLHLESGFQSWAYDPDEYPSICKAFPNTVITYLEFCLWAEYGESYFDDNGLNSNRNEADMSRWKDNEEMHATCYRHGEKYCQGMKHKVTMEMLMAAYLLSKKEYLSIDELRSYVQSKSSTDETSKALMELNRRMEHKKHQMILLAETMDHPGKLSMYDLCVNLYRPLVFSPTPRKSLFVQQSDDFVAENSL